MEIKRIAIVSDWGRENPMLIELESSLRVLYGPKLAIHFIQQEVFQFFALESIYYVRKALAVLGPGTMVLNLCDIYRREDMALALMETDQGLIISMEHTAYQLYDERKSEIKKIPFKPISNLTEFISELIFFLKNINTIKFEKDVPNNDFLPRLTRIGMEIQALHIDRFENIITNLTLEKYENEIGYKDWSMTLLNLDIPYRSEGWLGAKADEIFCYFNKAGLLKISKKMSFIASHFGFQMASEKEMSRKNITVKIDYDS